MPADRVIRRITLTLILYGYGLYGSLGGSAQGLSLGSVSEDRPIEISADSGIEWQQNAQIYVARGNAVAKRGATEVHADTLTAHYRPSKGKNDGKNQDLSNIDKWKKK